MMKDKLVKTGHKKAYYRFQSILRISAIFLGILGLSSIPVIVSSFTEAETIKAESAKVSQDKQESDYGDTSPAPIE